LLTIVESIIQQVYILNIYSTIQESDGNIEGVETLHSHIYTTLTTIPK